MSRRSRSVGFTIVEILIGCSIFALMSAMSWQMLVHGISAGSIAQEHLSAMQNAMLLMESIQEDVRQIAILNDSAVGIAAPLLGYTMSFSKNKKSMMFRKSSRTNAAGSKDAGAAFTLVIYQMTKRPEAPDTYSMVRLERSATGKAVSAGQRSVDERAFRNLVLKDVRWDLETRLEGMGQIRAFIRISMTVVNTALQAGQVPTPNQPKYYFLSNIFELESPEPLHISQTDFTGFAKKFIQSHNDRAIDDATAITAGFGYYDALPPKAWPDASAWVDDDTNPLKGWDYSDNGTNKNLQTQVTAAGQDPFDDTTFTAPPCRQEVVQNAVKFIRSRLSEKFRGHIVVGVTVPKQLGGWTESKEFDCSEQAKSTLAVQVNELLEQCIKRGAAGVAEWSHYFATSSAIARDKSPPPANMLPSVAKILVTTAQAQLIVDGQ